VTATDAHATDSLFRDEPWRLRQPEDGGGRDDPPVTYTVLGQTITVPVEVRSATMVQASWLVSATAAQDMIDYSGLVVKRFAKTLAMVSIAAVQYTDNDLGPYNEVALAVVVEPHEPLPSRADGGVPDWVPVIGKYSAHDVSKEDRAGGVTTFIHRLPVNQKFTCAAGRDIWGFPKWVCDITYRENRGRTDVVMIDKDDLLLGLTVRRGLIPLPAQDIEMSCYSWQDGVLRRTPWTNRTSQVRGGPAGARLELGTRHPMAVQLRQLGLPKAPIMSMSVGHLEATFGAAEEVTV
jgi:hypothetical protein